MYNVFIYKGKEKGKKQTKKKRVAFFFVYVRFDEKTERLERAAINLCDAPNKKGRGLER